MKMAVHLKHGEIVRHGNAGTDQPFSLIALPLRKFQIREHEADGIRSPGLFSVGGAEQVYGNRIILIELNPSSGKSRIPVLPDHGAKLCRFCL